jgi:hypothetical protein
MGVVNKSKKNCFCFFAAAESVTLSGVLYSDIKEEAAFQSAKET